MLQFLQINPPLGRPSSVQPRSSCTDQTTDNLIVINTCVCPLLQFKKYGCSTFLEVNVICLVVMYTNKVLRPCHMLIVDNTFRAERLTENSVCRVDQGGTDGLQVCLSLRVRKACYFGHCFFRVIQGRTK